jgi:hypothetical protein
MSGGRRVGEVVHAAALGIWLGAVLLAGAAAAIVFPTLKALDPHLTTFDKYDGPHWLLAGGQVAQRIFLAADIAQFACMLAAGLSFGIMVMWLGLPMRRRSTFARATFLLAALAVLSYRFAVMQPRWDAALHRHWAAAQAGDNAAAAHEKAALDEMHPVQTWLLGSTAGLVLSALIATGVSVRRDGEAG